MEREQVRKKFNQSGLEYSDIGSKEVYKLQEFLISGLQKYEKDDPYQTFTMELEKQRKIDVVYENGVIKNCFFHVRGKITPHSKDKPYYYFKRREAISFNTENKLGIGFIGFAGWADDSNVQPILQAADNWVHWLAEKI